MGKKMIKIWVVVLLLGVVRVFGAGTGEVVVATNEVVNYRLQKNQPSVTFALTNNADEPYLWVMAHACDNRKIEHGAGMLKIEVNGVVLDESRSVLQGATYRYPVHPTSWRKTFHKYDKDGQTWAFKYDVDFIMNSQTGGPGSWQCYTTVDYNHWYAFNLVGIARKGENIVKISEQVPSFEYSKIYYYDGFVIGGLALCSLDEIKLRVEQYDRVQIKVDPKELKWENIVKSRYDLAVPRGVVQKFDNVNGYLTRDGKPFMLHYLNPFTSCAGRENVMDIYNYFVLINSTMAGAAAFSSAEIMDLPIYLKPGWDRRAELWEIPSLLASSDSAYRSGIMSLPYICYYASNYDPSYLRENFPGMFAQFSNGEMARSGGPYLSPNLTHVKFQEYVGQMHTVLGLTFKDHPGICGYSIWEEMGWRVVQPEGRLVPQGTNDLQVYRDFLKNKYAGIQTLNTEWGTNCRDFSEVKFPKWIEQTANFANFQQWRAKAAVYCARIAYAALKKVDPHHFIMGQKTYGDILAAHWQVWRNAIDNWALTEWTDVSREYSMGSALAHLGRSSCLAYGGKVMEADICFGSSPYRQFKDPPAWYDLLDQKGCAAYPYLMQSAFNGNKAFHWEMYDLARGRFHFIYHNKLWKDKPPISDTDPGNWHFSCPEKADVIIPEPTLKISRFNQWCLRNASLVLPARVSMPQVAVLTTTSSRMISYDPMCKLAKKTCPIPGWVDNGGNDFILLGHLFDHLHLKFDCVEEQVIDNIFKYKVLIAGYQANVMGRKTAEKIIQFVKKGGTVLFYPEAGTWDSVNFQKDKAVGGISPGFGLGELCGVRIDNDKIIEHNGILVKKETSGYKTGETVMTNVYYGVRLKSTGGEVVAETDGTTVVDREPILVRGPGGKTWYFGGYLGLTYFQSYPAHERFAQLVEGILKSAGVEKPVEIEGATDRRKVIPGLLEGEGKKYWLVGVNNFDDQAQKLKIKVNQMPEGEYEVVDISGEEFTFAKGADGNNHMRPDPEGAKAKYVMEKISGKDLSQDGFTGDIGKYMSKVWLIRPAGCEVWVNSTVSALKSYVELGKPLKIVVGYGCNGDEERLAGELSQVLAKKGLTVAVVKDNEIKTKVVEGSLVEDGYELEKYRHEVIDDDANLIVVGNAVENSVAKHLETAGNYVFSKVPEIVSEKYPGKGRGIVQIAECVNAISYDATDKGRDAILAGGSDREGAIKAVKELTGIMKAR